MGTRMEVAQLESRMNTEDYRKLQSLFQDPSGAPRSLSRTEFINLAWSSVGRGSKEEYGLLFDSVVVTQDHRGLLLDIDAVKEEGRVDWAGLCSFLLLELSDKVKNDRASSVPCWKPPRTLTCPHRDPVQKVLYLQSSGQYLTVSKGGTVGLRDREDMSLLHTHRLQNSTVTPKDLWVTDMVLLHNLHKVAVSFTSKEVCFYDILSKPDFRCKYKLQGLKFTPWCLDYWVDPSEPDQAVLTIGDIGGQVSALYFTSAQISLFERLGLRMDSDSADIILWDELVKGKHRSCYIVTHQAHAPAWVRKVRYLGSLEAFVSCSTRPQSSMVIGWREKESRSLRVTSFFTKRGVWDMDHHRGLKLIATAGADHQVLLWNPYVTSEPVCTLGGHTGPVTAIRFMQAEHQLLSYSKDKVLCLWDVSRQLCVRRLDGVFPKTQEDAHTLLFLHEERQLLLLSFNSLLLLLETTEEEKRTSSHEHPVTCVLYNSLFRQVVSSDSASSVICWLAHTGQKVKQFHRCHGNAEISTMALDGTQTRLFTAGSDGEVKVWNFNGRCLHRMNAGLGRAVEISHVLLLKRSILVMGWERMLTVFRLHSFSQSFVEPSEWQGGVQHRSDVLCAAFQPPQTLVTGSYDGEITVWNNSTEKALRKLRPHAEHREGHYPDSHFSVNGTDNSFAITRLFFIPGRTSAATGGADLVSCGGSGVVRLWNTVHGRLVGQFTAHSVDLGSIITTVSPCGKYLITADREGTLKTWDVQHYCLEPDDGITTEPPELLRSFRPHLDRVTHLEMCLHGDRLLVLSASSDCSVALSYLPGDTVGLFGQKRLFVKSTAQDAEGIPEPSERRDMNLNDFVVLPNNKAKSVKLNARNLQELQMETMTLAQESKGMEEKLQQLKESMSKEKEERGHSGGFRWKSGRCGSLNCNTLTPDTKKNKENRLQKLSAGKVKIRVLKDEPLTAPPQPPPPPSTVGLQTTRKNRLKGKYCGQCEVKAAGLMCAECTEDYCVGCFTKFHQKGALKLHRMIPIQTDLQTSVSTRDVVGCFQKQINPRSHPSACTRPAVQLHPDPSQVEMTEDWQKREDERGVPISLIRGEYNEEESARSFQEALRQWRGEKNDGSGEPMSEEAMWIRPVSVSAVATQADLAPDRGGRGGGEGMVPVRVEFKDNSLTYMDRLLLKKHRRTPIKTYRTPLAFGTDLKSLPSTNTGEETASLTAQEEDFHRYCASLFAVPVSRGRTEPQITIPESCLVIEVLDETDVNGVFVAEQRTDNNRKAPSVQQVISKETLAPQTALTSGGSSRVNSSSPSPAQPSRQSREPAQPKAAQKPQTSQAELTMKASSSKSKPSASPTAETPTTPKTSIKTPTSMTQKPNTHKTNADRGSIHFLSSPSLAPSQTKILKSIHSPASFPPDVSPLASTRPLVPEEHLSPSPSISFSLRSTFTVSPSSSSESTLLPEVYQSIPLQTGSDSSLLPEQPQTPQLFPKPISSLKLSQLSPRQSQHSRPESLLSDSQLQLPLSPVSSSPNPPPQSLEPSPPVKALRSLSLLNKFPPDASSHGSTPTQEDSSVCISGEHELTQYTQCIPSCFLDDIKTRPSAVKMEEEEEPSIDSGDDMSSDSLGLVSHEEDSSDEEAQMHTRLMRGRSREEGQENPAISRTGDPFVPADADRERDSQTDEQEQLSEPSTVMHNQSAGSGSERLCDLDGFTPLGLDMNSGHSDPPRRTHCDPLHTCQTSEHDSEPPGSEGDGPISSLCTSAEEHLFFRMMKDNHMQPTEIQIRSTRPTRRGEISENEVGTSGSRLSGKSTSTLSHRPKTNPSPLSAAVSSYLSHSPSPPLSACLSRPTSGSELGPAFRPLSRAAQEIMEICSVDQTGCEDPDLDTDTTAHTLHSLEQELRLTANAKQATVLSAGNSGSQDRHGSHHFTRAGASEEEKDEEAAAQRDRQSVLSLP